MTRFAQLLTETNLWVSVAIALISILTAPALTIIAAAFGSATDNWSHIQEYLLTEYITQTAVLFVFSGLGAVLIGVSLAYIITVFDFPYRKFFRWALIMPLAIPAYIGAYTYSGMVSYTGVVTTLLHDLTGQTILIDIMSLPGAIFIFTFFLFPYIYIISRAYFANYTASLIESSRMLGKTFTQTFFQVILPVSRGTIAAGCSLVLMEVANDYGVVSYFGVNTFGVAIFKVWFGMNDLDSAVRLCLYLMAFVVVIMGLEKMLRNSRRYAIAAAKSRILTPYRLSSAKGWLATLFCLFVFSLGFLFPFLQLIAWAALSYEELFTPDFAEAVMNTLVSAFICATLIIAFSVIIMNSTRLSRGRLAKMAAKLTVVGYSVPGAVIAIGVLTIFVWLTHFTESLWNYSLITSLYMLYFAYMVRFLAVGCSSVENGFDKIGKSFLEAARTLGCGVTKSFFAVEMKMILPSLVGGFSLIFVDMCKELPLTLILRPFNYNTLATKVYEYAHDERIHQSAPAALVIIVICAISVYYVSRLEKE